MKNYKDSDYAANRYSKSIVYKLATETIEITLESYLAENPSKTAKDFAELKALSDVIYLKQDRDNNAQTKRNISIHELEETTRCSAPSPEDDFISKSNKIHTPSMEDIISAFELCLTDIQCHRAKMYWIEGKSEAEIATLQGVSQQKISKSIKLAREKLKIFLKRGV